MTSFSLFGGTKDVNSPKAVLAESNKIGEILSFDVTNYSRESSNAANLPPVIIGDHQVSPIWDEVAAYPIAPYGAVGKISSIHDSQFIYFKIEYDLTYSWIAMQWDGDRSSDPENFNDGDMEPMAEGDDMWIFGETEKTGVYGDAKAMGQKDPFVLPDKQNDLFWELLILNDTSGSPISFIVEVGRPLTTNDVEGNDVQFLANFNVSVYFASNVQHRPDSNIAQSKFVISNEPIGGNITIPVVDGENATTAEPDVKVMPYLFYNVGIAFFISGILYAIVVYFSVLKISKEVI